MTDEKFFTSEDEAQIALQHLIIYCNVQLQPLKGGLLYGAVKNHGNKHMLFRYKFYWRIFEIYFDCLLSCPREIITFTYDDVSEVFVKLSDDIKKLNDFGHSEN